MLKYLKENLQLVENSDLKDKEEWYTTDCKNDAKVNTKDLSLFIKTINSVIYVYFERIYKLTKYLKNIANFFNLLNLPITWDLPSGLQITQSYLRSKTISITPFTYSKTKLNSKKTLENEYDKSKQVIAFMPNLIHSLDANTLCDLYKKFFERFEHPQFYSIHDCFGTTAEKVFELKYLLASVYTGLYSTDNYLLKFDRDVIDFINNKTDFIIKDRDITLQNKKTYKLYPIDWVLNKKQYDGKFINSIDS